MRKINIKWMIVSGLLFALVMYSCKTRHKLAGETFTLIQAPGSLERGKKLVYSSCGVCHYNEAARKFIGKKMEHMPGFMGSVFSANLTRSETYGITSFYSNAQLAYLIKTGINKDGHFIPYMLRPNMADDDVNDIIVFLRSKDPAIAAADTSVGVSHHKLVGRLLAKMEKPMPYTTPIKRPDNPVANGRYLVDNMACYYCHSKNFASLNHLHPEKSKNYMQGGMEFGDPAEPDGKKIVASNLTPGKNGIGKYTKDGFSKAVIEGKALQGRMLQPPMHHYSYLSEKDVDDIYAYLHALPPMD